MTNTAPQGPINLFEAVNYGRRETLVVLSADRADVLLARLAHPRPAPIAHWGAGDEFALETIVESIPLADAEEFLQFYLENAKTSGWKMLVWRG
jgi:hypothetical protein